MLLDWKIDTLCNLCRTSLNHLLLILNKMQVNQIGIQTQSYLFKDE